LSAINRPVTLAELPAHHPLRETSFSQATFRACGRYFFPSCMQEIHRVIDVDTPENRFVKYFLAELRSILARFNQRNSFLNPELKDELRFVSEELERFCQSSLWHEVGEMRFLPTQSTVLQRRDGYRQLFRLYSLLQMVSRYDFAADKFDQIVELKDIPTLYEYWCFFQVKQALEQIIERAPECAEIVSYAEENSIKEGLELKYGSDLSLYYNCKCPAVAFGALSSYSINLRPDIMIRHGDKILVLDAKYKSSSDTDKTIGNAKDEDILKMHAYREAIHNVWGAFALFPGSKDDVFHKSSEFSYEGVGAIALKPNHPKDRLREIIREFSLGADGACL
jgi:uncharacterized protein